MVKTRGRIKTLTLARDGRLNVCKVDNTPPVCLNPEVPVRTVMAKALCGQLGVSEQLIISQLPASRAMQAAISRGAVLEVEFDGESESYNFAFVRDDSPLIVIECPSLIIGMAMLAAALEAKNEREASNESVFV